MNKQHYKLKLCCSKANNVHCASKHLRVILIMIVATVVVFTYRGHHHLVFITSEQGPKSILKSDFSYR